MANKSPFNSPRVFYAFPSQRLTEIDSALPMPSWARDQEVELHYVAGHGQPDPALLVNHNLGPATVIIVQDNTIVALKVELVAVVPTSASVRSVRVTGERILVHQFPSPTLTMVRHKNGSVFEELDCTGTHSKRLDEMEASELDDVLSNLLPPFAASPAPPNNSPAPASFHSQFMELVRTVDLMKVKLDTARQDTVEVKAEVNNLAKLVTSLTLSNKALELTVVNLEKQLHDLEEGYIPDLSSELPDS